MIPLQKLLGGKSYRKVAEVYFAWLLDKLGEGDSNLGFKVLCSLYNKAAFKYEFPMELPVGTTLEDWFTEVEIFGVFLNARDKEEISYEFENLLKEKVESALHESDWLNP